MNQPGEIHNDYPTTLTQDMNNENIKPKRAIKLSAILLLTLLTGCSEYWWTRGQPPATLTMLSRSQSSLDEARSQFGKSRPDISDISSRYEEALVSALDNVSKNSALGESLSSFQSAGKIFDELDGHLSIGSRPAYGELSGQLRKLIHNLGSPTAPTDPEACELFASRSLAFLARELATPAPRPLREAIP